MLKHHKSSETDSIAAKLLEGGGRDTKLKDWYIFGVRKKWFKIAREQTAVHFL
jgi:hypothetical protein